MALRVGRGACRRQVEGHVEGHVEQCLANAVRRSPKALRRHSEGRWRVSSSSPFLVCVRYEKSVEMSQDCPICRQFPDATSPATLGSI